MFVLGYASRVLLRSPRRTLTGILGTLLAVGLLSSVLLFVSASSGEMTQRTIASVPVDMRAQALTYDLDMQAVEKTLKQQKGIVDAQPLTLSHFSGSRFDRDGKTYTTGTGAIIAIDNSYFNSFPAIRLVQGSFEANGIVLSQDMGTNLSARVGDTIQLQLPGAGPAYAEEVTGIANMRNADALFSPTDPRLQGAAFNPPVNVILIPLAAFDREFAARLKDAPPPDQSVTTGGANTVVQGSVLAVDRQIHLKIDRAALAGDPTQAQLQTTKLRLALEKLYPNQIRVSDDLYAAIDTVKADVLWAQVLFVFLALPGILLGAFLSRYTAEALVENQRREFALLRARGASGRQILAIVAVMSLVVGLIGSLLGLLAGLITMTMLAGPRVFTAPSAHQWGITLLGSLLAGLVISALASFLPARRLLREEIIVERRVGRREGPSPWWMRLYLDVAAILASAIVFRLTQINGFHPVLNAEGNPTISPSFYTFLAPLLFWIGSVLLLTRLASALLRRSSTRLGSVFDAIFGQAGNYAATTSARRASAMSRTMIVVALALSFGLSISIFASTYAQQQRVDAELTLGSDVKITPASGHPQTEAFQSSLVQIPGVAEATPFKTTVAYVGSEIQDIFGIGVATLKKATNLSDAFFPGSTAAATMDRMAATPDGILISDEMARDYSIVNGDHITIRLYNEPSKAYQDAHFTVAGIASEFPTVPKDAFLVVNLPALVQATGDPSVSSFLVKTVGEPAAMARSIQSRIGPDLVKAESIETVAAQLTTSLTSLNLNGLQDIDYLYTFLIASVGLGVFLLTMLTERRREFATMRSLGAAGREIAAFVFSEVGLITLSGLVVGALIGAGLATMLVLILTGIFDPPPAGPIFNYAPLVLLAVVSLGSMAAAMILAWVQLSRMRVSDALREA